MRAAIQLGILVLASGCLTAYSQTQNPTPLAGCIASPNAPEACAGLTPTATQTRPGLTTKPSLPPLGANELQCFGAPYGVEKRDYANRQQIARAPLSRPEATNLNNLPFPSPRILVLSTNLPIPPEIQRIERGYITAWAGGFINDGLMSWSGIDLDRREVISVQRRIYDKRATLSRPFSEPVFNDWDHVSIARTWSTDQRTETEVVTRRSLRLEELNAFVCIANGVWGVQQKSARELMQMMPTDTLASNATLLDRTEENGAVFSYTRSVDPSDPLAWAASQILKEGLPRIDWAMKH